MIEALAALPFPNIDPIALQLGPIPIRWYALSYIAGILLGWWGISRALRQKALWAPPPFNGRPPATEDQISDLAVWIIFGVILGGRLGWVLIYGTVLCSVTPSYAQYCDGLPLAFVTDPVRIIAAWEGGMSFHGGLIGTPTAACSAPCRRSAPACARASSPWRGRSAAPRRLYFMLKVLSNGVHSNKQKRF